MRQLIHEFQCPVIADGVEYVARAYGAERPNGLWDGWIEFIGEDGVPICTDRETTQSGRGAVAYWASGLEPVYLEGAFERARGRSGQSAAA